jgi:hypothetical protein
LKGCLEDVPLLKKAGANYSEMSSPFVKNWGFIKEIVLCENNEAKGSDNSR